MLALRLRYNLHCPDKYGILPPVRGNRKSYSEALVHYSTPACIDYESLAPRINSEADNILSEIDNKVQKQHDLITKGIISHNLDINPWLVTGFLKEMVVPLLVYYLQVLIRLAQKFKNLYVYAVSS